MSLCPSSRCGCSFDSDTLEISRAASGLVTIEMPDAYADAYPVFVFLNEAERDAELPSPEEGMEARMRATDVKYRYTGSAWRIIYQPITAYTPTFSGVVSALGAVTVAARYWREGDTVHYTGRFALGAGTTFTAGLNLFRLTLPVMQEGGNTYPVCGSGRMYDASTNTNASASCSLFVAGEAVIFRDGDFQFGDISATSPWTWGTGDELQWTLSYPAL
ncbi:MAG: hypothetical protein K0R44_48 [Thermomicrobiales bacterium]|jgi:hypothetical protein|nr:hypothetical protein [Thermomicrobiales bacterium]MDF3014823.1 hypothetical protein [Thermomicrobiales bacterium]